MPSFAVGAMLLLSFGVTLLASASRVANDRPVMPRVGPAWTPLLMGLVGLAGSIAVLFDVLAAAAIWMALLAPPLIALAAGALLAAQRHTANDAETSA